MSELYQFRSIKQVMRDGAKALAKDLAWKSLSKEERKAFLEQAKEKQQKKFRALAIKCIKEANEGEE